MTTKITITVEPCQGKIVRVGVLDIAFRDPAHEGHGATTTEVARHFLDTETPTVSLYVWNTRGIQITETEPDE